MIYDRETIHLIPETPGVYLYLDNKNKIIYVGKASNLKKRVSSYFYKKSLFDQKTKHLILSLNKIEIIEVANEFEALILEANLIRKHLPKYNIICRDDRHYLYITISKEEYPRVILSRKKGNFGPFPSHRVVCDLLRIIRSIIPFCTQNSKYVNPCFYTHLGLCKPCPAVIRQKVGEEHKKLKNLYLKNIKQIRSLLSGKIMPLQSVLFEEMYKLSLKEKYEGAIHFRNRLNNLDYLINRYRSPEKYLENPQLIEEDRKKEIDDLYQILLLYYRDLIPLHRIECYDISNITGKYSVGSMVTFINGKPDKQFYRRFKVKIDGKVNDFAMLKEIILRRLKHYEWPYPNLIILDGGKPQLLAVCKIFHDQKQLFPVIGLAKRLEEIVIPEGKSFLKIILPQNSPALHLVQRLRDEAHRFAHKYHQVLRLKHLFSFS